MQVETTSGTTANPESLNDALAGVTKIVVAIHGIGSQRRSDTIRSVAERFSACLAPEIPSQPLGFFRLKEGGEVHVSRLAQPPAALGDIGFAEVYWADIPRKAVLAADTLQESKCWARSVVSRTQAMYERNLKKHERMLNDADFKLGASVLDELIETISVLENLSALAEKAGLFRFDVGAVLRDYLGDVQVVAEFATLREQIVYRFHSAMAQIVSRFHEGKRPQLYIVAHSEGSVVSFLALLQAMTQVTIPVPAAEAKEQAGPTPPQPISTAWIEQVRGYMTIGSPIDKHLALWDGLWSDQLGKLKTQRAGETAEGSAKRTKLRLSDARVITRIEWRNYYDYGDPVGFKLNAARDFLRDQECEAFNFEDDRDGEQHDLGFSRYVLPGKAHVDYWGDNEVFRHFINDVVVRDTPQWTPQQAQKPKSKRWVGVVSTALPYVASLALHWLSIFLLFKAVTAFLGTEWTRGAAAGTVFSLAWLLAGGTAAARGPRLVKRECRPIGWRLLAASAFAAGALPCILLMPLALKEPVMAGLLQSLDLSAVAVSRIPVAVAGLAALSGWLASRKPNRARWLLLGSGAVLVAGIVCVRLWQAHSTEPLWPVAMGGAAFLYLWWLAILVFDLAFVWHRYIRQSVGVDNLRAWTNEKADAKPTALHELLKRLAPQRQPNAAAQR